MNVYTRTSKELVNIASQSTPQTNAIARGRRFSLKRAFLILVAVSLGFFVNNVAAQVTLTASAGTASGSFTTLKGAFDAINAGTHQGDIVISINASTTETAPCVLNSSGAGSAIFTSVLIQPTADGVSVSGATATGRGLVELNGADNVTIDGDNAGSPGINRNLTFANTAANSVTYTSVIRIALSTLITSADNNIIRNCIITGSAAGAVTSSNTSATATGVGSTHGILVSGGASTTAATTAPSAISSNATTIASAATALNLVVTNNSISACGKGVYVTGSAITNIPVLTITKNIIGNPTAGTSTNVAWKGISAQGFGVGSIISENTIYIETFILTTPLAAGIEIGGVSANGTGLVIEKNIIARGFQNNTGGRGITGINMAAGNNNIIRNNFIYNVKNIGSASFSTTFGAFGILLTAGNNTAVYHNSVSMYGSDAGTGNIMSCLAFTGTGTTGCDVRNNIFSNVVTSASTTSSMVCVYFTTAPTAGMALTMNNNAYYTGSTAVLNGIGQVSTTKSAANLYSVANFISGATSPSTNWRAITSVSTASNDNASFASTSAAPFTGTTDLHIPAATVSQLESGGASVGVVTDLDGDARPGPVGSVNGGATAPDMGADEFDGVKISAPVISNVSVPTTSCTPSLHTITADVVNTSGTFTVTLNYNNGSAGSTAMSLVSGNTYTADIPAAPAGTSVTWSITATNSFALSASAVGTSYKDAPLTGLTLSSGASPNPACAGSATLLTATLNGTAAASYTPPPAVGNPTTDEDFGNITITQGASTILNNTTTGGSLVGTIGTASGTNGSYSNFTAFGPYVLNSSVTYNFSVSSITQGGSFGNAMAIYIDYNRNGSFSDPGEEVYNQGATITGPHTSTGSFTVPSSVNYGLTRMRVLVNEGSISGPTITPSWGEYEEYAIKLLPPITSYSWSDGVSNVASGNPATVFPPAGTTIYTPTILAFGCTLNGTGVSVSTLPQPNAPLGVNGDPQCGVGIPTITVKYNTSAPSNSNDNPLGTFYWYTSSTGGTAVFTDPYVIGPGFSGGDHSTYPFAISMATTFYVSQAGLNGCESPRIAVTQPVNQPDIISTHVSGTNICANSPLTISVTNDAAIPTNNYTYTWTASPAAGSGLPSGGSGASLNITPTAAGSYVYTVTAVDGICTSIANTVSVTVKVAPTSVVASSSVTPCTGFTTDLGVSSISGLNTLVNYSEGFEIGAPAGWSFFTAGGSPSWLLNTSATNSHTGNNSLVYQFSTTTAANAWGITGAQNLTAGVTYSVKFWYKVISGSFPERLKVTVGNLATIAGQTTILWDNNGGSNLTNTTYAQGTANFTPLVSGAYYFGFNCYSLADEDLLFVDDITITGGADPASTYSWTSIPAGFTSSAQNPTGVVVNEPTTYLVTVTNSIGCSADANVFVDPHPIPSAPSTTSTEQCGPGIPSGTVSSNSGFSSPIFNWYDAQTGGTLLQSSTTNSYLGTVTSTVDYWVSEISSFGCESGRTKITFTVTPPDPITVTATNLTVCVGGSTVISSSYLPDFNTYDQYKLNASPLAGSGLSGEVILTGNSGGTGTDPYTITPTGTGTYVYTITAIDNGKTCQDIKSVSVTVNPLPVISSVTKNPATPVCAGTSVTLNGKSITNTPGVATIGAGTVVNTNISYPTPFGQYYGSGNIQMLVKASELSAAGLVAGNINSLAFDLAAGYTYAALQNFQISIAHTGLSAMTTTPVSSGFTSVYGPVTYTPSASTGYSTIVFSTGFNWDGVSNIVVDVWFSNCSVCNGTSDCATSFSNNGIVNQTATSYVSTLQFYDDDNCTINSYTPQNGLVSGTTNATTYSQRANMKFGGQFATDLTGTLNWEWNPGALAGSTVNVTPGITTVYTAKATVPATGCFITSSPVTVTVNPIPAQPIGNNSIQCGTRAPDASVMTGGSNGVFKWYDAQTGGTLLQTGGSTYLGVISGPTHFWVSENDGNCESLRTDVFADVTIPDPVMASANQASICQNGTVQLSATNTAASPVNVYGYTWTAAPAAGSGITGSVTGSPVSVSPSASGTIVYTVTAFDPAGPNGGCTATSSVSVLVNPNPVITTLTATPNTVCSGGAATLNGTIIAAGPGSAAVATATGNTQGGSPFRAGGGSATKTQIIYTAAELSAAGFFAGNLTSIGFNFTTASGGGLPNFQIKIGHTAASGLTATFQPAPSTVVYGPVTLSPPTVTGLFTMTFTTPFAWDGVSNILVEFCHDTPTGSAGSGNVASTTTSGNLTSQVLVTSACAAAAGGTVQTARPVATFGGIIGTNQTANFNWVWNPGALAGSSVVVHPTTPTNYNATVTNPLTGCFTVSPDVFVNVLPVSATVSATPMVSCSGSTVTLNGIASGGSPFSYIWTDGVTTVGSGTSPTGTLPSVSVNPTVNTTYFLTVTDACGNMSTPVSVLVTVNSLPSASIAEAGPITICAPATQLLTAQTTTGSPSYQWTLNGVDIPGAVSPTYTVSVTGTGTYRVKVTEGSTGCTATSGPVVVTINPQPASVTATATNNTICFGTSTNLFASSAPGGPTVTLLSQDWESGLGGWTAVNSTTTTGSGSPAATAWTIQTNPFTSANTTPVIFNSGAGSKFILSNADVGGSGTSINTILTSPAFSTVGYTTLSLSFRHFYRFLSSTETFIEVSTNGSTWTNLKSYTATQGTESAFVSDAVVLDAYVGNPSLQVRFRYTDGWSWYWALDDIKVSGSPTPTYSWASSPAGFTSSLQNPTGVAPTVNTMYTVTAMNLFGCSTQASTTVNVTPLPVLSIDPITSPVCFDAPAQTLSATPAGGTFSGPGVSGNTFTPSAAGAGTHTITYSYTDISTGCSNTATVSITVNPLPPAPSITIVDNMNGTSTITATGFTGTLNWSNGGSDNPHVVIASGPYTVTQTDANGCTSPASNTVIAGPSITADPAIGNMDITNLGDVSQNANSLVHGQVYKLYLPVYNFEQDFAVPNGATKLVIDLGSKLSLNPGFSLATAPLSTYFAWTHVVVAGHDIITGNQIAALPGDFDAMAIFEVTSTGSCLSKITASFIVDNHASVIQINDLDPNNNTATLQYALPVTVSATSTNVVCNGAANGTITVTSSPGTTVTVNGNPYVASANYGPGTYTIVATAANDIIPASPCTATTSVTITEPPVLNAVIFAQTDITGCFGDHTGAAAVFASGGTPGYTYSWNTSPVQTTAIAVGLGAGTYVVTVTDANGCIQTASVTITQPTQVIGTITSQLNVNCNGNLSGSATVDGSGGKPGYTYSWNTTPVQTGPTANGLGAGTYIATITDQNGCSATVTVIITEPAILTATASIVSNVSCNGANNGSATVVVTGGTTEYAYSWNTTPVQTDATAVGLAPGMYAVTVTDAHGCFVTSNSVTVTEPAVLTLTATGTNNSCHGGNTGTVTATAVGGTTAYSYSISGPTNTTGASSGIFTGLGAGTYIVTVTDANGCVATSSGVIITEPSGTLPDISLGADYTSNFFATNGLTSTIVYNIAEIAGNAATGDTVRITKVSGYTFTFNGSQTANPINPLNTLDNQRWKIDNLNPAFVSLIFDPLHNSAPGTLNCGERVYVSIDITRSTPNLSTFTLSARLRRANTEVNLANNLNSIVFTAE